MCAFLLTRSQWIAEGRQLIRESSDDLEKMNTLLCDLGRAVDEGSKRVHGKQKKRDSPIAPPQTVRALAYADVIAVMRGLYQRLKDNNFEPLDGLPYVRVVFFMAHQTHACSTSLSTSVWHAPHTPPRRLAPARDVAVAPPGAVPAPPAKAAPPSAPPAPKPAAAGAVVEPRPDLAPVVAPCEAIPKQAVALVNDAPPKPGDIEAESTDCFEPMVVRLALQVCVCLLFT